MAVGDGVSPLASILKSFGGDNPDLLGEMHVNREQVERYQEQLEQRRTRIKRQRELEFARTSTPRYFEDESSTKWDYVIVDDTVIRITGCETTALRLVIPEQIEGLPVFAIGSDACSDLRTVEEIICADTIESIGSYAFRENRNLRKIVFPRFVTGYESSWLRNCPALEVLVLPGLLDVFTSAVFDNPNIKELAIGSGLCEIKPAAFEKTNLERITIDPDNHFMKTDGTGIYTIDGTVLLALACPVETLSIQDGCKAIGKKACNGVKALKQIDAPDSLTHLGEFAFAHSGLTSFNAPPNLEIISEKAFFYCSDLEEITLNEGIVQLGDSAFAHTSLHALRIPGSIEHIGASITESTNIIHAGPDCSLTLDESSAQLFIENGGLYRHQDDGIHLIQLIDRGAEEYTIHSACSIVDHHAFAFHSAIKRVIAPAGLHTIKESAFRYCTALESVDLPDSVVEIGNEAFLDTALVAFRVPQSLEVLGKNALVTWGAHHGDKQPSLAHVEVAPGNDRFYTASGMLCRRDKSGDAVVIFTSSSPQVVFPERIETVEEYAFNNARDISYLALNKNLRTIRSSGLTTWCWIEHIHVEIAEPVEGRTVFDLHFPDIPKSLHGISLGIGGASWVNVPGLYSQFDNCVVNAHDYNSPRNPDSISVYEQVRLVIDRLRDPILLTPVNRSMYERLLRVHLVEICVDIARHDDRDALTALIEWGYVNEDNLESIIAEVGKLQDAAMTGYLLEVKRLRFNKNAIDFDL